MSFFCHIRRLVYGLAFLGMDLSRLEFLLNISNYFLTSYASISFRSKILEKAADILIKEEVLSESGQLSNQVVVHLLPFMIITNDNMESAEMKIANYLSKSGICSLHPLLRGWKEGKKN